MLQSLYNEIIFTSLGCFGCLHSLMVYSDFTYTVISSILNTDTKSGGITVCEQVNDINESKQSTSPTKIRYKADSK